MSGAPALRLAVEADGQWRELTAAGPGRVERFRAPALRDAADKTARCAAAGATLATWSVAAGVREGLQAVGFVSDKAPGFGGKRDMLQGQYRGPGVRRTVMPGKRILVIGAGFAGTSTAHRLAERGYQVTLLDQAEGPGCGASGNRVGVLRPLPSLDDNRLSRLTRSAFLYTRRHLLALSAAGLPVRWGASGVLHLARDKTHEATQRQKICRAWPFTRHVWVSPPSWTKNSASISARERMPRNSAWVPSSVQSFGAGVAVAQSLYGVRLNASSSACNVLLLWCLMTLDSSSTTPINRSVSNLCSRS